MKVSGMAGKSRPRIQACHLTNTDTASLLAGPRAANGPEGSCNPVAHRDFPLASCFPFPHASKRATSAAPAAAHTPTVPRGTPTPHLRSHPTAKTQGTHMGSADPPKISPSSFHSLRLRQSCPSASAERHLRGETPKTPPPCFPLSSALRGSALCPIEFASVSVI